mgnify:CR=1 FL=1
MWGPLPESENPASLAEPDSIFMCRPTESFHPQEAIEAPGVMADRLPPSLGCIVTRTHEESLRTGVCSMTRTTSSGLLMLLLGIAMLVGTGCASYGPSLGPFAVPIPVSPYFQDQLEDRAWEEERYKKVVIMGPITSGPHRALDPPSHDEIMRALEKARPLEGGLPFLHEVQRKNVRIVIEPLGDYVDPPRVYPLIGPAQLHHAHYKCIIYFTEVTWVGWPIPHRKVNEDACEVVYIDHCHLHLVGNVDPGPGSPY